MAKKYFLISFFILAGTQLKAQQYGLFNTGTLFDAFENPAQKAFVLDSSRKYASNLLLPYFGLNAANKGEANITLRSLINDGKYDTQNLPIGDNNRNKVIESTNIYLFMFRIFTSHKYHKELGFSWQVRSDAFLDYTNESLVVFDNYHRFIDSKAGLFNGNGWGQSYHQFSINYRENYNKRLAFGAKLSLLSGITYNNINITQSNITVDPALGQISIGLAGTYKSNFFRAKELSAGNFVPDFKNPGLSVGFGTTYSSKSGIFIMGSVKDLGFIKWNNDSHSLLIDDPIPLSDDPAHPDKLEKKITDLFESKDRKKGFYTPTNARADFLISKKYDFYTPGFILSKNLFYQGGDIAFVNSFKYNDLSISVSPAYNMIGFLQLGTQAMYQTPNFEFFMGTDNLLKTTAVMQKTAVINTGNLGASFYMGLGIKFGYIVEHPQNSSYMPGVGDDAAEKSFFSKLFGIFRKKK